MAADKKETRGGSRPGSGRKKLGNKAKIHTIRLTEDEYQMIIKYRQKQADKR